MAKITIIGGGGGVSKLLYTLRGKEHNLSAIISMADSGGSTGKLRKQYGVSAVGDLRKSISALSQDRETASIFEERFAGGDLDGHPLGNIILSAAEMKLGSIQKAVDAVCSMMKTEGKIVPVTETKISLHAEYADGQTINSESAIDNSKNKFNIKKIWIEPEAKINAIAEYAIKNSDLIIIGPGDFYTSIIPNFLVEGVIEAIKNSSAKVMFIGPLFTKPGETYTFSANDFVRVIEDYIGKGRIDLIVFNDEKPSQKVMEEYERKDMHIVSAPIEKDNRTVSEHLLDNPEAYPLSTALKTAKIIEDLLER